MGLLGFLHRKRTLTDPAMNYLIAGLGNIGAEYSGTRHNIGFMILDAWAQASNISLESQRYGDVAVVSHKGRKLYLLKPSTYMNLSGNAVRYWVGKLHLPLENVLVICDDLNLPFGTLRLRRSGSDGGHNGLKNIAECLGTQDYARIRVGIGNDYHPGEQIDYVLSDITQEQREQMSLISAKVIQGCKDYVTAGPEVAMNILNVRKK